MCVHLLKSAVLVSQMLKVCLLQNSEALRDSALGRLSFTVGFSLWAPPLIEVLEQQTCVESVQPERHKNPSLYRTLTLPGEQADVTERNGLFVSRGTTEKVLWLSCDDGSVPVGLDEHN